MGMLHATGAEATDRYRISEGTLRGLLPAPGRENTLEIPGHRTSGETLWGLLLAAAVPENMLDFTEERIPVFTSKGLHCLHLNVRS